VKTGLDAVCTTGGEGIAVPDAHSGFREGGAGGGGGGGGFAATGAGGGGAGAAGSGGTYGAAGGALGAAACQAGWDEASNPKPRSRGAVLTGGTIMPCAAQAAATREWSIKPKNTVPRTQTAANQICNSCPVATLARTGLSANINANPHTAE